MTSKEIKYVRICATCIRTRARTGETEIMTQESASEMAGGYRIVLTNGEEAIRGQHLIHFSECQATPPNLQLR